MILSDVGQAKAIADRSTPTREAKIDLFMDKKVC
jgi:hypothetical protein